jgi:hypothetical protein
MNAKDRAFRKQLLLIKGDALRVQARMELGLVRQRLARVSVAWTLLSSARRLLVLFSAENNGQARSWRSMLKTGLRSLLALKSWRKVWDHF